MDDLFGKVSIENEFEPSKWLKTSRMHFVRSGEPDYWDIVDRMDHVCIFIYNKETEKVVLIRQIRAPILKRFLEEEIARIDEETGKIKFNNNKTEDENMESLYTYEICAGLIDKSKSVEEIAVAEVEEECGYRVSVSRLQYVSTYYNIDPDYSKGVIFYVEVENKDKVSEGGGLESEGERIQQVLVSPKELEELVFDPNRMKPCSVIASSMWFLRNMKK